MLICQVLGWADHAMPYIQTSSCACHGDREEERVAQGLVAVVSSPHLNLQVDPRGGLAGRPAGVRVAVVVLLPGVWSGSSPPLVAGWLLFLLL